MRLRHYLLILLFISMPTALYAELRAGQLPAGANWYLHVDFVEMREAEGGRHIYAWLQDEAFAEVREEAGVDLDKEADRITAYASGAEKLVVLVEGKISQETQDKILGMGAATGTMDRFESGNKAYYFVREDSHGSAGDTEDQGGNYEINGLDNGAYFSLAVKNKVIVTSSEDDMKALLANRGRIPRADVEDGALVVLSADSSLIQAGLDTDEFDGHGGWNSNIVRNTEQAALLIADEAGKIAIEAQLVTAEKAMANALASIIRGLISLQVFNDDMDPEIAQFLQNTSVAVEDTRLTVKVSLDPEVVIAAIE